jgi:hypothetical protein
MKNSQFLRAFLTMGLLLVVLSCRDSDKSTLQPKPNKQRGARAVGNSDYYNWQNSLTWTQQNWLSQQTDPEDMTYSLWNDEMSIAAGLSDKNLSTDITIYYPLYCYQIALAGAHHVSSIGATKAQEWVQMTYVSEYASLGPAIMSNFNVGKQVVQSNPTGDINDRVYRHMFVDAKNYTIPGSVSIGTFEGVPIFRNSLFRTNDAVTLPARTRGESEIHLSTYESNRNSTKSHEFGHILQKEHIQSTSNVVSALGCFWYKIAPASLFSAWDDTPNYKHLCFWTETTASVLAANYFCPSFICWNRDEYPFPGDCPGYEVRTVNQMCN